MNKILLSIASISAVLLFVGAGCSEAQNIENNGEIRENNNPIEQPAEAREIKEEDNINGVDTSASSTVTIPNSAIKIEEKSLAKNTNGEIQDDRQNEEENENENEREDEDEGRPISVTPRPTAAPTPKPVTPAPTTPPTNTVKTISMAEVKLANNQSKCWSVISGKVYDLTPFTPNHPGGDAAILGLCGKDGTAAFMAQHGGQSRPETTLAKYFLAILK